MTNTPTTSDESSTTTRRTVLRGAAVGAGAFAVGGVGLQRAVGIAAAAEPVIETCGEPLDVVLGIDYSGSIRNAAVWNDVRGGTDQFIDLLRDRNQVGVVTFGDSPVPYDFGTDDWLVPATSGNRLLAKAGVPTNAPPGENATHLPGTIDYSTDMLEAEGRGINEVLVLVTDGGPNY
jgi:Mg-chelatase subunit ChlD